MRKGILLNCIIGSMAFGILLFSCNRQAENKGNITIAEGKTPIINFKYLKSLPHDTTSFTEGLLFHEGKLFESTGSPEELTQTRSVIGILNTETGSIEAKIELKDEKLFGEGIVFLKDRLYQLTYKNKIGFIYNATTFVKEGEFTFPSNEGWGLTTDGIFIIMSDGTNVLTYLDPQTLQVLKKISVTENGMPKPNLNELEYIGNSIYANVWPTNKIVRINPKDGNVTGEIDLTSIASHAKNVYPGALEMNGIAYDSASNSVYITGKLWPKLFELRINL